MRYFQREPAPAILSDNQEKWTEQLTQRVAQQPNRMSAIFDWPKVGGKRISELIKPVLERQTHFHCSYCDGSYMLSGDANATIDHFRPKSDTRFIRFAFDWHNLYLACRACQGFKKEQFDDLLLQPDAPDFEFERYFEYDFYRHEINPQRFALQEDQRRAEITINIFRLNHPSRCETRRACIKWYLKAMRDAEFELDTCNYRYLLVLDELKPLIL